jgi:hypothetical protein
MYQSLSFDTERERRDLTFYPRSNRGLVFVTKPSRKQNLFFQNKFILGKTPTGRVSGQGVQKNAGQVQVLGQGVPKTWT